VRRLFLFILGVGFLWSVRSFAQMGYAHPELAWFTIKTEHFEIHYHEGAERSARVVAKIAEDIYQPITELYNWRPDGVIHFIIKDHDDNSNGAAFYYDNKVEIWAPQMTFALRGTNSWLRNVVSHEFSHMISLGASRKMTRKVPAAYFQWINYEPEKRSDVLYGYPNQLASYAVPMTIAPMWLAEGMAQFMAPDLDYDEWDSHRDMLIRTAVVNNSLHSFAEMGVFGKNSIGNERTYNAGYALTRYIAHEWGPESLRGLAENMKKPLRFTINGSIKAVTGLSGEELYEKWQNHLKNYYDQRLSVIKSQRVEGELIVAKGIGNVAPVWSPDGRLLAFCGSETSDYLTLTNLKIYDATTAKVKTLKSGVNSQLCWSPDGMTILYSRERQCKNQSQFNDLHVINVRTKKEKRLTEGLRAIDPSWSPDGERIICVVQKDGTDNLLLLDKAGKSPRQLTSFANGEGVYTPRFSPDGKTIVFSQARKHGRNLKLIDVDSGVIRPLIVDQGDARDPVFSSDGSIYFSWDITGIYNIYRIDTDGSDARLLTNVIGGAFMPSVAADSKLAFALFDRDGYKISVLENPQELPQDQARYVTGSESAPELQNTFSADHLSSVRNYNDDNLPEPPTVPYAITYGQFSFLPRVMVDSLRLKLGTYFYASDVLDQFSVLGGVAMNAVRDLDIFTMFEYRKLPPTLFVELYYFTRNVKRSIAVIEDYPVEVPIDVHFRIVEGDVGGSYDIRRDQKVRASFVHSRSTSDIGDFYFRPQNVHFTSPANTYFIGNHLRLQWALDNTAPGMNSGINPTAGRKITAQYSHEWNKFFVGYSTESESIALQKEYTHYNVNKIELDWNEYLRMPWSRKHALNLLFRGGWMDRPVDSFFNFFAGGMPGLRGYPYYAIEGRKMMIGRATYRFPIFSHWQKQLFNLTTNKLYASTFFEIGNAFDEDRVDFSAMKRCYGGGLRMQLFSFYGFPTAIAFDAAYSIDKVVNRDYTFGREWRYYFTLLFDFMD
jgi:Tol biopolymer transport system component